jgi:hypothetical protein
MSNFIERLYTSDEPTVCYKTRVYLFDEDTATPATRKLQDAIKTSERIRCLLAGRDEHGKLPSHPYSKWYGALSSNTPLQDECVCVLLWKAMPSSLY